jgi:isopenicillin N synthase-like dioxygenase
VEKDKLFTVAKEDGVFYLDLTEDQFEYPMTALSDRLYDLSRSLFSLELEDKLQYDIDKIDSLKLNGYEYFANVLRGY